MKTLEQIFPLKGFITQEIIDKSYTYDTYNCIGTNTLREALGEDVKLFYGLGWGRTVGCNYHIREGGVCIGTVEDIDFMRVQSPQEVTFIIL